MPNPCDEGEVRCDEECVDLGLSQEHCGVCGVPCSPPVWTAPLLLENNDEKEFRHARFAVDASGNIVVAFQTFTETSASIWINTYSASDDAWRGELDLLGGDVDDSTGNPLVAFLPGGQAQVVYRYQPTGSTSSRLTRVHTMEPEPYGWTVQTVDSGGGWGPEMAQNSKGRSAVIYFAKTSQRYAATVRYDPVSAKWSLTEVVSPFYGLEYTVYGLVAVSEQDLTTYLYDACDPSGCSLAARSFHPVERWNIPTQLARAHWTKAREIAFAPDGTAFGIWTEREFAESLAVLKVRLRDASTGLWSEAETLSDPGSDVSGASLAVDSAGKALVVWDSNGNPNDLLQARQYDPRTSDWTDPVAIDQSGAVAVPHVATTEAGDAFAFWRRTNEGIYSARYDAVRKRWSPPVRVDTADSGAVVDGPWGLVGADGTAYAVWNARTNDKRSIWFSRTVP